MQIGNWKVLLVVFLNALSLGFDSTAFAENNNYQAGFDCSKAKTETERYICSTRSIAELDFILNKIYTSQLKSNSKKKQSKLKNSQKAWLRKRNECIGHLPSDKYTCVLEKYRSRIIALGGVQQLITYYKKLCATDEWACETVGDLELSIGRLAEAIKYYTVMCEADRDGDAGGNCYKKATVLEKLGKINEAKVLYTKTCQARNNNDACEAALRLGPKLADSDQWSGLYRNDNGSLFIKMKDAERFTVNMETRWANGHSCGFVGKGSLKNGKAKIDVNSDSNECTPEITKTGKIVSIIDPTGRCRSMWCGIRGVFEGDFVKE